MPRQSQFALLMTFGMFVTGCQPAATPPASTAPAASAHEHDEHAHEGHSHEGPHHGAIVELGNEEFHAEIVHDDATGTVTVYLLDSSAKKSVTTTATEAVINLKHGDTPEQFKLTAQPEDGTPAGQTSRFTLTDKELLEHLHDAASAAKLNVTIGETPYSGAIPAKDHTEHDHDHAK